MKTFTGSSTLQHFILQFRWFFPLFKRRQHGAQYLIPIPVQNRPSYGKRNITLLIVVLAISNIATARDKDANVPADVNRYSIKQNLKVNSPQGSENLISNLYANVNGSYALADGNMVLYNDNYSNAVDNYDARKLTNPGENFGLLRSNSLLAVEKRKLIRDADSVFYDMTNLKNIQYKLEIKGTNLNHPTLHGFLEDAYTGIRIDLNLNDSNIYFFNVTPVAGTSARNRFRIVFTTLSGAPLPVNFSTVTAKEISNNVVVNWEVNNEFNVKKYQVESSVDGRNFSIAGEVIVARSLDKLVSYQWTDNTTFQTLKYYRIKSVDADGQFMYSATAVVTKASKQSAFLILSNPVQNDEIRVLFQAKTKGSYRVTLTGLNGTRVFSSVTNHAGGTAAYFYQLPAGISSGTYYAEINDAKNNRQLVPIAVIK